MRFQNIKSLVKDTKSAYIIHRLKSLWTEKTKYRIYPNLMFVNNVYMIPNVRKL